MATRLTTHLIKNVRYLTVANCANSGVVKDTPFPSMAMGEVRGPKIFTCRTCVSLPVLVVGQNGDLQKVRAQRIARRAVALRRSIRCDAGGDADTGAAVKDVLDGSSVFLVGMMGTGKSSVGKKLAASLGYSFFDTYVRATPLSPRVGAVYPLRALSRDTKKKTRARRVCEMKRV